MRNIIISAALFCVAAQANENTLTGRITDQNNQPLANVEVQIHGSNKTVKTTENGEFEIIKPTKTEFELHVNARGYEHKSLQLNNETKQLNITLNKSMIEYIDVFATPMHTSTLESASPISVLSDYELRRKHSATLGETLKGQLGIHSSYFGPVSSSPIIRGLDGPRVMIAQNGLDNADVSRAGPDHVVSSESSTARQIEILKGPATLSFGNGAIGGVINVVDNKIPTDNETTGHWSLSQNTVANEQEGAISLTSGFDQFAFHVDAFSRTEDDYKVPENPILNPHEEDVETFDGHLENSSSESDGYSLGTSYLLDNGYVGISYSELNKHYGIPGHSHEGHGEHEEHEEESEAEHEEHAGVFGDMNQQRLQVLGRLDIHNQWLESINFRLGDTQYRHAEIENGEVGTQFFNDTQQIKTDLLLTEINEWHGALTFDIKDTRLEAIGAEANAPASETSSFAIALLEEKHFGNLLVQLGVRYENIDMTTAHFEYEPDALAHHEEEGEHGDAEEHGADVAARSTNFTPISLSAGVVWDFAAGQNVGLSFSRSERAPSASEIFAFGPHIGTNSYEIGSFFELHDENGETHIELHEEHIELEVANNIDITYRKFHGDTGILFNVFYNRINNFYYQADTGLVYEAGHEEHEVVAEPEAEEHEEEGLPVFITTAQDATLYGSELQLFWQATEQLKITTLADFTRARLTNGDNLPRIPPARFGLNFDYQGDHFQAQLEATHYLEQDKITSQETKTDAYTMLDGTLSYHFFWKKQDFTAFVQANNLLDQAARVHSSYLKDITLLPGRNVKVGIRAQF